MPQMDFHNPKVRTAMVAHIRFAIDVVSLASVPQSEIDEMRDDMGNLGEVLVGMVDKQLMNTLIAYVLNFTLSQDFRLKNSLVGLTQENLKPEQRLEDMIL